MSHFSVLVVSDSEPTEEVLRDLMQPYHQFECTGTDDQYIQDVDITDETRKEYEESSERRFRDSDGTYHEPWDDQFYRDPTDEELKEIGPLAGTGCGRGMSWSSRDWGDGKGYRTKIHSIPEGYEEVEVATKELMSFRDYVEEQDIKIVLEGHALDLSDKHKYGYAVVGNDGQVIKIIDRTNPNRKWDYWRVGGRYAGKLQAKNQLAATQAPLTWEWNDEAELPNGFDVCQVCNLDKDGMKAAAVDRRRKWAMECCDKAGVGLDVLDVGCQQKHDANEKWSALESKPRGGEYLDWLETIGCSELAKIERNNWELPDPKPGQSIAEWIEEAPALTSFAVLMDGTWYERGEMGWWACVSNEDKQWDSKFNELIAGLRDDQWLAVLDCHI